MAIHESAIIGSKAELGRDVSVGPFTIIHDGVIVGGGTTIDSHCEIGYPTALAEEPVLRIGKNSLIRSHSIIYAGSTFGDELTTGHRVTVRENTRAGVNLQIGTLCDLQGDCEFGDYVRMHSNVHVGKKSRVGNFVWLFPYVVLTNDPHPPSSHYEGVTVEDYAVVATASVLVAGVMIGEHSLVGAQSLVHQDVEPHSVVSGNPARRISSASAIKLKNGDGGDAYPWPRHFRRGYPESVTKKWDEEYE